MKLREFTNNAGTHYVCTDNDDAPPLLLLHGVTGGWQSFLPLIPTLALRWQVYALTHRGHGQSARAQSYLVTDYVPDAVRFLRDEIKRPAAIYGHSLGAMVAAAVAAEAPDLTRAVVLEDPPFHTMGERIHSFAMTPYFAALQELADKKLSLSQLADAIGAIEIYTANGPVPLRMVRDASALRFTAKRLQQLDPALLTPIVAGRWLEGYDLASIARGLRCPLLLLQADAAAGGMLIDEDASLLEQTAADVTRVKLPGIGHQIHASVPDTVLRLVLGFLESL